MFLLATLLAESTKEINKDSVKCSERVKSAENYNRMRIMHGLEESSRIVRKF
jgi:hypothetical protein